MKQEKIIKTKQDLVWYQILYYLEGITDTGAMCDKEFKNYFEQLMNYVTGQIELPSSDDIVNMYVVVEQVKS